MPEGSPDRVRAAMYGAARLMKLRSCRSARGKARPQARASRGVLREEDAEAGAGATILEREGALEEGWR